jgi:hypothetical protein
MGTLDAFDNVEAQIGACGIWCGSCVVGNGTLRELTRRFEELTVAYGSREWAPRDFSYEEFSQGLASIRDMGLCPGCVRGGGRDDCEIRACASRFGLDDCELCPEPAACQQAAIIETRRSGALEAGLVVRTGEAGRDELLAQWTADLAKRWPCRILFEDSASTCLRSAFTISRSGT